MYVEDRSVFELPYAKPDKAIAFENPKIK